jgi:hypothetical protein
VRVAADERRVHQLARRVEPGDEAVQDRVARRIERAGGGRKVRRIRIAGYVRVALSSERDVDGLVATGSPEVCEIDETRVDHERTRCVICAESEPVRALLTEREPAVDRDAAAVQDLEAPRLLVAQRAQRRLDQKLPARSECQPVCASVRKRNPGWIRARRDQELVLQLAVRAAEDHVDAGPEVAVDDLAKGGDPRPPRRRIAADEVVDPARALALPGDLGRRVRAHEAESERQPLVAALEREHGFLPREEEARAARAGRVPDGGALLPRVLDEREAGLRRGHGCRARRRDRDQREERRGEAEPREERRRRARAPAEIERGRLPGVRGHDPITPLLDGVSCFPGSSM